jgi:hypothetical protein
MLKTYLKKHSLHARTKKALTELILNSRRQVDVARELGFSKQRINNMLRSYYDFVEQKRASRQRG